MCGWGVACEGGFLTLSMCGLIEGKIFPISGAFPGFPRLTAFRLSYLKCMARLLTDTSAELITRRGGTSVGSKYVGNQYSGTLPGSLGGRVPPPLVPATPGGSFRHCRRGRNIPLFENFRTFPLIPGYCYINLYKSSNKLF